MGDIAPHDLHRMVRTWLLSEDPYGLNAQSGGINDRIEPTFGSTQPQQQTPEAPTQQAPPGRLTPDEIAAWARVKGRQPTAQEIKDWEDKRAAARRIAELQGKPPGAATQPKGAYRPPWKTPNTTKGSYWGGKAVSGEMDKANAEMKADQLGGNAVARELGPELAGEPGYNAVARATSPAAIRDMIQQMSQPQPSAYTPEEAAAYASWQGHNAVAGVTPPRGPAGWYAPPSTAPTATTETTNPNQGYAPSAKRASHWGLKAVENWLDKEPE